MLGEVVLVLPIWRYVSWTMAYDLHLDDGTHLWGIEMREHGILFWGMPDDSRLLSRFAHPFRDAVVPRDEIPELIRELEVRIDVEVSAERLSLFRRFLEMALIAKERMQGLQSISD